MRKKECAPTVESQRANVGNDTQSIPRWGSEGMRGLVIALTALMAFVLVCETGWL